ncbi:MAG: dipicolinate synthase subunit B [Dethiobacteria bacterium]|jgi:dipicolinate synthase subunit B|nr:dipicolinate synthase subunit B [Bacillota bacterium]HQD52927.1 dipicolinate synthase subunit B [Bacillota bacterium]
MSILRGKRIGVALTGSHCTIEAILPQFEKMVRAGADLFPILSPTVRQTDTRFGTAAAVQQKIEQITGRQPWLSIVDVEPIGPKELLDLLLIAPCTGNSMAKLARGISDSAVLMAAKAQLRNGGPLLLAISTNDALGLNAGNLAVLLNTKNVYMVPFGQDNPASKPNSLVARPELIIPAAEAALTGRQLQPLLVNTV